MEVSVGHRRFVIGSWFTASHCEAGLHWLSFRDDEDLMDSYILIFTSSTTPSRSIVFYF